MPVNQVFDLLDCSSKSHTFPSFFSVLLICNFGNHIINFQELFLVLCSFFVASCSFMNALYIQISLKLVRMCLRYLLFSKLSYPTSCPMYMFSSFSSMLAFLKCLVIFGYTPIFKNERQSWPLYANREAFLNYCLVGIVPVWELCVLVQGMPISRHHCRVCHWQLRTSECQNEGALLFGAIFILEVLHLICSCSISLERTPGLLVWGINARLPETLLGIEEGERRTHLAVLETDRHWLPTSHSSAAPLCFNS